MRRVTCPTDFEALRDAIAVRAAGGWTLFEGVTSLAGLATDGVELVGSHGEVLLRAGDAGRMWRVTGWEERGGELRVEVRGPLGRPGRVLRIAPDGFGPFSWGDDWFEEAVRHAIERHWGPDSATLTRRGDRIFGSVRTGLRERAAVIAVAPRCPDRFTDDALAAGIVLRDRLERATGRAADLLVFSAPPAVSVLAERLVWCAPRAAIRLFDVATTTGLAEVRPHDQGGLPQGGRAIWSMAEPPASALVARMLAVAPAVLRHSRRAGDARDRITMRGLEIASARGNVASFGTGKRRARLDDASWPAYEAMVRELEHVRSADAPYPQHPLYRAFPERWLVSTLRDHVEAIDPLIDPGCTYEQVPAFRGQSRDRIDLLAVRRGGRLAVIEVKAAEDRALPLQGLNYWSRVRWHHLRGEIARRGYFPGIELDPRPPVLYMVAPLFRMHASVSLAVRLFAPDVEAIVVGLNTNWRRRPVALTRVAADSRG